MPAPAPMASLAHQQVEQPERVGDHPTFKVLVRDGAAVDEVQRLAVDVGKHHVRGFSRPGMVGPGRGGGHDIGQPLLHGRDRLHQVTRDARQVDRVRGDEAVEARVLLRKRGQVDQRSLQILTRLEVAIEVVDEVLAVDA